MYEYANSCQGNWQIRTLEIDDQTVGVPGSNYGISEFLKNCSGLKTKKLHILEADV